MGEAGDYKTEILYMKYLCSPPTEIGDLFSLKADFWKGKQPGRVQTKRQYPL